MKRTFILTCALLAGLAARAQVSSCTYSGMLLSSGSSGPSGDDDVLTVSLPFSFRFYDSTYNSVTMTTNAVVWMDTVYDAACCNGYDIPSEPADGFIALTQTDWYPVSTETGVIYYGTVGTSPNRVFVVHYDSVQHISSSDRLTGEIQLFETTNEIRLVVRTLTGFESSYTGTMGIAAGDGIRGLVVDGRNQVSSYSLTNTCYSLATSSTSLPVSLVSYEVVKQGDQAQISWTSGMEEQNSYFEVERSADGRQFSVLGRLNSKGNGGGHRYSLSDHNPLPGKNIYRLAQHDLDGKVTYYGTRTLTFAEVLSVQAGPNPFSDQLSISLPADLDAQFDLQVSDIYGKIVSRIAGNTAESARSLTIPTKEWSSGVYLLSLSSEGRELQHLKLVKQ